MTNLRRNATPNPDPLFVDAVSVTRFWRLVDVNGPSDCWPWQGDTRKGYGVFQFRGELFGAHELALSFTTGERRLAQLDTCHSCDNPVCVNPAHLRFDSRISNVRDMVERGRYARPSARLTPEEVLEIRERRDAGAPQALLAEQYGVSPAAISAIVRGLRWAHLGGPIQTKNNQYRRSA